MKKTNIEWTAMLLLVIGGLNWGLVGLFDTNVLLSLLGSSEMALRIAYVLVGIAAIYAIPMLDHSKKR
ncbi:MAG: DUF378 domain-containing protein [Candidatus Vogelbacteria bacterium]|nr:DUF378 domain-containing protein [Candidatus Vogelbacteria bacterium]